MAVYDCVNEALSPRVIEQGNAQQLQEYIENLHSLLRYATHRQQEMIALVSGTYRQAQRHADLAAALLSLMPTWLQQEIGGQQ